MAAPSTRGPRLRSLLVLALTCLRQADSKPDTLQHRATEDPAGSIEDSSVGTDVLSRGPPPVTELGAGFGHLVSPGLYPAPQGTEEQYRGTTKESGQSFTLLHTSPQGLHGYNKHKKRKELVPKTGGKMHKRNRKTTATKTTLAGDFFDSAGQVMSYKDRETRSLENIQECFPDFSADVNSPYHEKGKFFKLSTKNCDFGVPREAKIKSAHIFHKHSLEACTQVRSLDKEVTGLPCAKCQDQELVIEIEFKLHGGNRKIKIELVDKGGQRKEACSISLTPWTTIIILSILAVMALGVCITWATGNLITVQDAFVSIWNTIRQRCVGGAEGGENGARVAWADSGDTGGLGESEGGAGRAGAAEAGRAGGVGSGGSGTGAGGRPRNQRRRFCAMS